MLKDKKILIGISGGIAAYKIPILVRLLVKEGAEVKVMMTNEAENFVTKKTLSVLSKNKVETPFFDENGNWNNHVKLGLWADLIVIAPATANTIAKMAHGICDNFLIASYMSSKCPVFIAPAMDEDMYLHFSTHENIKLLRDKGHFIIPAEKGELASGLHGEGRMEEPEKILSILKTHFTPLFKNKNVLINAGPTYEKIDPVRFIGNRSSGKTGVFLADAFAALGANVILILGPSSLSPNDNRVRLIRVESALEMHDHCLREFENSDIFIASAAVADFRPEKISNIKIKKKSDVDSLNFKLIKNPDIVAETGKIKKSGQLIIGYALETDNHLENAERKMVEKNLDLIILNSANIQGEGFSSDNNRITIIEKNNKITKFELMHKRSLSFKIAEFISTKI